MKILLCALALPWAAVAQPAVLQVHAAGSLRGALTEIGKAFEAAEPGTQLRFTFGPSGLLKDRLAGGEKSDVFASANTEHPQALADRGLAGPARVFAQNALCVPAPKAAALTTESVVDRLLDPAVRVGTSTPKADLFVTYCTNATAAVLEEPTLAVTALPASVNVATRWVDFRLGPQGQAVLGRLGFGRP